MNSKKVTVIITTYNRFELLKKAVNKVINQTYKDIEVLVCDDCSTDDTYKILDFVQDDRVKYIPSEKNVGYTLNCKNGINNSTGEYILFVADDDSIGDDDYIEEAVKKIDQGAQVVFGQWELVKENQIIKNDFSSFKEEYTSKEFFLNWMRLLPLVNFSTFLIKKEFYFSSNAFESVFERANSIDLTIIMKCILKAEKISFIKKVGYQWRLSQEDSLSGMNFNNLALHTKHFLAYPLNIDKYLLENEFSFLNKEDEKKHTNKYLEYSFYALLSNYQIYYNNKNFDELLGNIKSENTQDKKIFIYGYSQVGVELNEFLRSNNIYIEAFVDDFRKNDKIISYEKLVQLDDEKIVIIGTYKYKDIFNIYKKLIKQNNIIVYEIPQREI